MHVWQALLGATLALLCWRPRAVDRLLMDPFPVPSPGASAVLLTGATGLLGPHLLKELEGRDLWVLCRPPAARLSTTATVLEADLAREDLGLSDEDLKRLRAAGIATIVPKSEPTSRSGIDTLFAASVSHRLKASRTRFS